ncbi:MAG: hypothetical protein Q7T05_02020, partial [Dehalococcoidia bacterium]|nr:hypothetical protein [Dehalococcoidia bacterium]
MQMSQESDYLCWDQTEVLHWTSRRRAAAGGDMTATIHHVRRHMVGVKEAATSGGAYSSGDVLFFVPAAVLPESIGEPKMADWIADDQGVRYTALSVDHRRRDSKRVQTYKVQARDLTIVFELLDIITI